MRFILSYFSPDKAVRPFAPTRWLARHVDQIIIVPDQVIGDARHNFVNGVLFPFVRHEVKIGRISEIMTDYFIRACVPFPIPLAVGGAMPSAAGWDDFA